MLRSARFALPVAAVVFCYATYRHRSALGSAAGRLTSCNANARLFPCEPSFIPIL